MAKKKYIYVKDMDNSESNKEIEIYYNNSKLGYVESVEILGKVDDSYHNVKYNLCYGNKKSTKTRMVWSRYYDFTNEVGVKEFLESSNVENALETSYSIDENSEEKIVFKSYYNNYFFDFDCLGDSIIFKLYHTTYDKRIFEKKGKLTIKLEEIIVYNDEDVYLHTFNKKNRNKNIIPYSGCTYFNQWGNFIITDNVYDKIINNPKLIRLGMADYITTLRKDGGHVRKQSIPEYLKTYIDHPKIEQLVKSQYTKDFFSRNPLEVKNFHNGTNVKDILGVPNYFLKLIKDKRDNLFNYRKLYNIDKIGKENIKTNKDWEDLLFLMENLDDISFDILYEVIKKYSLPLTVGDIAKYIERVRLYQAIPYDSTIAIWKDYLKMVSELELSEIDYFPNSLKLNHDLMARNYQYNIDSIKENKFEKKRVESLKYEMETENHVIIVPNNIKEVINEGKILNHCVASYIDAIIEGTTSILFLRAKEDIDKPLYTIEVKNDIIYQIKGKSNRLVSDAEIDIWEIIHILEDKLENLKVLTKVS